MRVLITGVCGFVGATLARGLRDVWPDLEIAGLDNFVRAGSELNRGPLRKLGVNLRHGDIRNASDLEDLPPCEWILDAAANPSVLAGVDGKTSSRQLIEHNLAGTVNLLELANQWQSGFIMLSTSRVYSARELASLPMETKGDRFVPRAGVQVAGLSAQGVAEDFSTEPPLSLYGASKRASEVVALEYAHTFKLPLFINRCGVLAGAGQFGKIDQGIFSFWIHSWRAKRPLRYVGFGGEGYQVRDCLHARDLLPLIRKQLKAVRSEGPQTVNCSGGLAQSASLRELSLWCQARFGRHEIGSEDQIRPFDIPWVVLDSSRAQQLWDWRPEIRLEAIWTEIAEHAEQNPRWLEATTDS